MTRQPGRSGSDAGAGAVLILSLFPGIGMLDMAFEEAGFCVVRGPDLLWGGDVHRFHPPAGCFDGVIGGPPCQFASEISRLNEAKGVALAPDLIPEFERCVAEAAPAWFLMENVVQARPPAIAGYAVTVNFVRDSWCGGETMRKRRLSIGTRDGRRIQVQTEALHRPDPELAITSGARAERVRAVVSGKERLCSTRGSRMLVSEMMRRQGLPADFFGSDSPFTVTAQRKMIGSGVPLAMGRAAARSILAAYASPSEIAA